MTKPLPDEVRCMVHLVHPGDKSEARCTRHRDHQQNADSDHLDEHGHHAPVLIHQSTIEEVRRVSRSFE